MPCKCIHLIQKSLCALETAHNDEVNDSMWIEFPDVVEENPPDIRVRHVVLESVVVDQCGKPHVHSAKCVLKICRETQGTRSQNGHKSQFILPSRRWSLGRVTCGVAL